MKKLSFFLIASMLTSIFLTAQETEFVVKKEFQEKTNTLGAQVSSVKQLSANLNNELFALKETVAENQALIISLQDASAQNSEALAQCKTERKVIQAAAAKFKSKAKTAIVVALLVAILALLYAFTIKRSATKKIIALQKQVDETNNMLIKQSKSLEKKIAVLNDSLADMKESKKKSKKDE